MTQVAIIGAGLSGLALAIYCKKYGIDCAIYEARPKDYTVGGNIALSPNALSALDKIGVYEPLRTHGYAFDEVQFVNGQGSKLASVLNGCYKAYNYPALRINRNVIRDVLIDALRRLEVPIYYEKKCVGICDENKDYARVEFADGEIVTADHIVAADGIHSKIRPYVRPDAHPTFQEMAGISGVMDLRDLADVENTLHLPCFMYGATGNFAIMPASADGQIVSFFASYELKERSRQAWNDFDANKRKMSDMIKKTYSYDSTWPPLVKALCNRTPSEVLTLWPFYQVAAGTHWASPHKRVILVGDAAHAMPPSGGQGGATAFEDAETLGHTFGHIYGKDFQQEARPEAIQAWQQHRIPRIQRIQDYNNRSGGLRKTAPTSLHQWYKETCMKYYLTYVTGPKMGVEFIYSYDGSSVRSALGTIGRPKPVKTLSEKVA